MLRPLFHLSVFAINSLFLWYDQTYITFPFAIKELENWPFRSRSLFLTMWCLMLQTAYHFIAFLNDILGTNVQSPKKAPIIRQIKDTLFVLAFPTAIYVSIAFWGIYFIDRDLIFPEHLEKIYPPVFNHLMHSTVSLFILIELLTSYRNNPSKSAGYTVTFLFYVSYIVWFFFIYAKTGAWVYPVFEPLNWPLRIVFIMLSLCGAAGLYVLGEKVNKFVGSTPKELYTNGIVNGTKNGTAKSKKKS